MRVIVAAIHGILTGQTRPSWPDELDAWLYREAPEVKVVKKEYQAGPFPRWNCLVRNPRLADALANELWLLANAPDRPNPHGDDRSTHFPPIWLIAHSNGANIALLVTKRLIARGCWIGGILLTGAACEADLAKNHVLEWLAHGQLGAAVAYCSAQDRVVPARGEVSPAAWLWARLAWPYGSLGRTGWLFHGKPATDANGNPAPELSCLEPRLVTRWCPGGHSGYFSEANREATFARFLADIRSSPWPAIAASTEF